MYNAKEFIETQNIPSGEVIEAIIMNIADGFVKDFIKPESLTKFDNKESNAINISIEGKYKDQVIKTDRLFTYELIDGKIVIKKGSNLAKYLAFYKKLPEVSDKIKIISNAEGFFKILF